MISHRLPDAGEMEQEDCGYSIGDDALLVMSTNGKQYESNHPRQENVKLLVIDLT